MFLPRAWLIVFLALSPLAGPEEAGSAPTGLLLEPYLYHGEELPAGVVSGETWLALVRNAGGYALVETQVTVEDAHDAILDAEGEATGKLVSCDVEGEVVVLLRDLVELAPGPVAAVQKSAALDAFLFPGQSYYLNPGSGASALKYFAYGNVVATRGENWFGLLHENYTLAVQPAPEQSGDTVRELASLESTDGESTRLIFAGDLNRDGHLDLLLDISNHYNVSHKALFLSHIGADGEVNWEKVADLRSTGC